MFNTIKMTALSAVVGLGALAAMPATASADSLYLKFGQNGSQFGVQLGDSGRSHQRDQRNRHQVRTCSPDQAVDKARRMGIRNARVTQVGRQVIRVNGRQNGHRVNVTFARAANCPVVRY